jgi:hypothetical protein
MLTPTSLTRIRVHPLGKTLAATTHFSVMSHNHKADESAIVVDKDEFEHHMRNLDLEETTVLHAACLLVTPDFRLPHGGNIPNADQGWSCLISNAVD